MEGEVSINEDDRIDIETISDTEENVDGDIVRTVKEKKTITSPSGEVRIQISTNKFVTKKISGKAAATGGDDKVEVDITSDTEENEDGDSIRTVTEKKTITSPNGDIRVETSQKRYVTKKAADEEECIIKNDDKVDIETTSDTEEDVDLLGRYSDLPVVFCCPRHLPVETSKVDTIMQV